MGVGDPTGHLLRGRLRLSLFYFATVTNLG